MDIEAFRLKVRDICRQTGFSQKQLAVEMNLHPTKLSHKLNNNPQAPLTHTDVRQLITVLARWQAISEKNEALELLTLAGVPPTTFSEKDWNSPPLNQLTAETTPRKVATLTRPTPPPEDLPVATFPESAPPTESANRHNLPVPLTPLVGRKPEIERVTELLHRADVRLLTLTGVGGVGKTRLAIATGFEMLSDFEQGVWFVDLAALTEPERVAPEIARAFGLLKEESAAKRKPLSMLDTLKNYLAKRRLLLILDNFEQILGAAFVVRDLLSAAPGLKILVTSRFLLRLYGEYEYQVAPFPLPNPQAQTEILAQNAAIELFVQRVRTLKPDFRLNENNAPTIAEICSRLEGLPLALELAAARLRLFTPTMLLEKLRQRLNFLTGGTVDQAERHRTLRAALEWSYELLSPAEKQLFARFAIFQGGCSLEALSEVAGFAPLAPDEVLELTTALVEKSVLKLVEDAVEPHLYMLETIREYALEKLQAGHESTKLAERHAAYFFKLAEEAAPQMRGAGILTWQTRLRTADQNFQAALTFTLENAPLENFLRFLVTYAAYWRTQGYLSEGFSWCKKALEKLALPEYADYKSPLVAKTLEVAGNLANDLSETGLAEQYFKQALALAQEIGDPLLQVQIRRGLGRVYSGLGHFPQSNEILLETLAQARQLGNELEIAATLNILGGSNTNQGNYNEARAYHEEAIALYKKYNAIYSMVSSISGLGSIALFQSEYGRAKEYLQEAISLHRKFGNRLQVATSLNARAIVSKQLGEYADARRFLQESQALHEEVGNRTGWMGATLNLALVASDEGDYDQAWQLYIGLLEQWREAQHKMGMASCLYSLGDVARFWGDYRAALKYHEEALQVRREIGDKKGIGYSLYEVGRLWGAVGDYEKAAAYLQESLELREQLRASTNIAESCHELGVLAQAVGDYEKATVYLERALSEAETSGSLPAKIGVLLTSGELAVFKRDFAAARRYLTEGRKLAESTGRKQSQADVLQYLALLELEGGQLLQADELIKQSFEIRQATKYKTGLAEALVTLSLICRATGQNNAAQRAEQDLKAFLQSSGGVLPAPYANRL